MVQFIALALEVVIWCLQGSTHGMAQLIPVPRLGGHLVYIEDEKEQEFIVKNIVNNDKYQDVEIFWLGGTDAKEEGTWYWLNGEVFYKGGKKLDYANWDYTADPVEPNNSVYEIGEEVVTENYLTMYGRKKGTGERNEDYRGLWNDVPIRDKGGYRKYYYICEWEL